MIIFVCPLKHSLLIPSHHNPILPHIKYMKRIASLWGRKSLDLSYQFAMNHSPVSEMTELYLKIDGLRFASPILRGSYAIFLLQIQHIVSVLGRRMGEAKRNPSVLHPNCTRIVCLWNHSTRNDITLPACLDRKAGHFGPCFGFNPENSSKRWFSSLAPSFRSGTAR